MLRAYFFILRVSVCARVFVPGASLLLNLVEFQIRQRNASNKNQLNTTAAVCSADILSNAERRGEGGHFWIVAKETPNNVLFGPQVIK